MRNNKVRMIACIASVAVLTTNSMIYTQAANTTLPAAGAALNILGGDSINLASNKVDTAVTTEKANATSTQSQEPQGVSLVEGSDFMLSAGVATSNVGIGGVLSEPVLTDAQIAQAAQIEEERYFSSLVIAQVNDYVNVRSEASEESEIIGKLYDKSVGEFIEEQDGWFKIKSGNVTGFVKGEYVVTGEAAIELAKQVGKRIATVNTTTLRIREEASTESKILGQVPIEDELTVVEEQEEWVRVSIEEGEGFVSKEFVDLSTEFVKAESKAEEDARIAKEEAARKKANAAADKSSKGSSSGSGATVSGSGRGSSVASYALQFVGNPYVYGGSSLTGGTDCSGFTMSVYRNFGISLPHSSGAQRGVGADVGGLGNAQPGDIVCYSGHVGIYIGGGQIVHASTAATGIKVSNANYRQVLSVRRIF